MGSKQHKEQKDLEGCTERAKNETSTKFDLICYLGTSGETFSFKEQAGNAQTFKSQQIKRQKNTMSK